LAASSPWRSATRCCCLETRSWRQRASARSSWISSFRSSIALGAAARGRWWAC